MWFVTDGAMRAEFKFRLVNISLLISVWQWVRFQQEGRRVLLAAHLKSANM